MACFHKISNENPARKLEGVSNEKMARRPELKHVSNEELVRRLEALVHLERKTTAEILDLIREIDRRKLYLELGHTSLFSYLTKALGYTPASAQRRIDSARLLQAIPELKKDLAEGKLNLMQTSLVAQSLRQKQKQEPRMIASTAIKKELLEKIKDQDLESTQKILSRSLNLPVETYERSKFQKDESLRIEMTLSKEQQEVINRSQEILSHVIPGADWAELFTKLAEEFVRRKDPVRERRSRKSTTSPSSSPASGTAKMEVTPQPGFLEETMILKSTSKVEAAQGQVALGFTPLARLTTTDAPSKRVPAESSASNLAPIRKAIPLPQKRAIFQRDQCCQWKNPRTGQICGSKFQLQIDHKRPLWAEGQDLPENLQLLCSGHNQLKYRRQAGIRPV